MKSLKLPKVPKILVITGPTATGKSDLALSIARKLDTEIISADSRLVYKDLDIVSAKPSQKERQAVPHHMINIAEPIEPFSAGEFVRLAEQTIGEIFEKSPDKPIIIAGGTIFYLKSLLETPPHKGVPANPKLRQKLQEIFDNSDNGTQEVYNILKSKDPKRAAEIHPNNFDKVVRAIELCEFFNTEVSSLERPAKPLYNTAKVVLNYSSREHLYEKINERTEKMFTEGLLEEFERNFAKYGATTVINKTIGYAELLDFKTGNLTFEQAKEKIMQHTRNYAKRQLTWLNSYERNLTLNIPIDIESDSKDNVFVHACMEFCRYAW